VLVIYDYLRSYFSSSFKPVYFILVAALLSILIYSNYYHPNSFNIYFSGSSGIKKFIGSYLLYFIPFAGAYLTQLFFYKTSYLSNPWLWVVILLAPAFFSARVNFDLHLLVMKTWVPGIHHSLLQCINWIIRAFLLLFQVYILWYIKERKRDPYYGSRRINNLKPYFIILLCMVPLVLWAGTQHDFLNMYPRGKGLGTLDTLVRYFMIALFEFCYGLDFISIEFFFRGFLVVSLIRTCGMQCILPAACFYCCIHFGKPMAEAISSFFGGMLLGIISYHTKSIWGGLVVHVGIAWCMELAGFLGNYLYS